MEGLLGHRYHQREQQRWLVQPPVLTPGKDSQKQKQKRHHVTSPGRRKHLKTAKRRACSRAFATRSTSPKQCRNSSSNYHQRKQASRMALYHPHNAPRPVVPHRYRRRHNNRLSSPGSSSTSRNQGNSRHLSDGIHYLLLHWMYTGHPRTDTKLLALESAHLRASTMFPYDLSARFWTCICNGHE